MERLTLFWILMAVSGMLFLAGMAANALTWLSGRVDGEAGASRRSKLQLLLIRTGELATSPRSASMLRALILDGILGRRLWKASKPRWIAHSLLAKPFMLMFALSVFTGFFDELLLKILHISSPLILTISNKDTPVMAVLNEALGVLLILGLGMILIRRYILRPAQLRTASTDTAILALLGVGLLTAYPVEALRFLAEGAPVSGGWFSFIGYPLYLLFRPLAWPWAALHTGMFFAHVIPFMVLLVYMPFSKFLHVIISPIVAATAPPAPVEAL